jgi:nicotinate phosphoribosyltransferase
MGAIYKLVELDVGCGIKRFTAKLSQDKATLPGAKQLFRFEGHDILARSGECSNGQAMLRPVLLGGQLVEPLPDLNAARARAAASLAKLPASLRSLDPAEPWPVRHSKDLAALIERTRSNLA